MCRSILSITERTVGVGIGVDREVGVKGLKKIEKGGRQYRGLHKIGRLALLYQLLEETWLPFLASLPFLLKVFHHLHYSISEKSHHHPSPLFYEGGGGTDYE